MELDKHRIYTVVNADEVKLGSKGYFADNIYCLQQAVQHNGEGYFGKVEGIKDINTGFRFVADNGTCFSLFYFAEEPEEKKYQPYYNTDEIPGGALLKTVVCGDGTRLLIIAAEEKRVCLGSQGWVDLYDLYEYYTWPDGTPCGAEEEQENEED